MDLDLLSPSLYAQGVPHDRFAWLRSNAPISFHEEPDGPGFWSVTTHASVTAASKDYRRFTSARGVSIADPQAGSELMMVNMDPPQHTRLRALVGRGFHPRMIATAEPHVRATVRSVLDEAGASFDFVTEVAARIPMEVIMRFLGVPPEDRDRMLAWSNTMIAQGADPEYGTSMEEALEAFAAMSAYASALAERRRAEPADDLITALAEAEIEGARLSELELAMFVILLGVAGNETTRNALSGGLLALIEHPEQWRALKQDPPLTPSAVEEILRWVTPIMHFRRTATEDVELGGATIKRGDKVLLWYVSANRDETVFADASRFDVARAPNPHVAFGAGGPHFCLGFALAQLEMAVVLEELVGRFDLLHLDGPVQRLHSNFVNGIRHMPVRADVRTG